MATKIRRNQLVAPFGPGAITVLRNGTWVLVGASHLWFRMWRHGDRPTTKFNINPVPDSGTVSHEAAQIRPEEFVIHDWRLEGLLQVNHFRLPPDFRTLRRNSSELKPNSGLLTPVFRFPLWHHCPRCSNMVKADPGHAALLYCQTPACVGKRKRGPRLNQVRYAIACNQGHLSDFPWIEWVHRDHDTECTGPLKLTASGEGSLAGIVVKCTRCDNVERSLQGIMGEVQGQAGRSALTANLNQDGKPFHCPGAMPWMGAVDPDLCQRDVFASLLNASNLYYPEVHSALDLPESLQEVDSALWSFMRKPEVSVMVKTLHEAAGQDSATIATTIRKKYSADFATREIGEDRQAGLTGIIDKMLAEGPADRDALEQSLKDIRRQEFGFLKEGYRGVNLVVERQQPSDYKWRGNTGIFSHVSLLPRLRETRALKGFSRLDPPGPGVPLAPVRQTPGGQPSDDWLPGYHVFGEGIFLGFTRSTVDERIAPNLRQRQHQVQSRYDALARERGYSPKSIDSGFMALHTLSHLLINRLSFECGYSSTALRERLYAIDDHYGVLIYTASGDSEGSLGGLVRMGRPGRLEPMLMSAIESGMWCASDPICIESDIVHPTTCNLAACHHCCMLPETACEEFNRFLDRGLLFGTPLHPDQGLFKP